MDEQKLMEEIIGSFCDAIDLDRMSKKAILKYVKTESCGRTYEIQKAIIRVHDLIHDFEREHLHGHL